MGHLACIIITTMQEYIHATLPQLRVISPDFWFLRSYSLGEVQVESVADKNFNN